MRYIDIDQIELPDGWQNRADTALNKLRDEISDAENLARANGEDATGIAAARKKAITDGLNVASRQEIWRDLSPILGKLSQGKCWYSESRNPTADKNVDHFRPKNRVNEEDGHEGYWWKAFDWKNFRYSSQWCNQRRNDKGSGTDGGKADHFPLCSSSFRAKLETDDESHEAPELLDPIDPEDWTLLGFRPNGESMPTASPKTQDYLRAEKSIWVYHLNCQELVNERRPLVVQIQRIVQELEQLRPRIKEPRSLQFYKTRQKELIRLIHKDSEYSSAALAYARAEIYKWEFGHQVKRPWLEDFLNLNI